MPPVVPAPTAPIPPPVLQLPWGQVGENGQVTLTPSALGFLQLLWASVQGQGGVLDLQVIALDGATPVGAQIAAALADDNRSALFGSTAAQMHALLGILRDELQVPTIRPAFLLDAQAAGARVNSAPVTTLNFLGGAAETSPGVIQLPAGGAGGGAYVPVTSGAEPLIFISDGAGSAIEVAYTP